MSISPDVLSVIVDPIDHQPLHYIESERVLYNERTQQAYAIAESGIPILLPDAAQAVDKDQQERLQRAISLGQSVSTGNAASKESNV